MLEALDAEKPITLYINIQVVQWSTVWPMTPFSAFPAGTCCRCGMAASMGSVILSGCEKGHRAIMKHGEVLLHQPLGGARANTDIKIGAERIIRPNSSYCKFLPITVVRVTTDWRKTVIAITGWMLTKHWPAELSIRSYKEDKSPMKLLLRIAQLRKVAIMRPFFM